MSVLTGSDFKAIYQNTKFYKLTNELELHNGFQYVDGLNVDIITFNPSGQCSSGGLYFTELNKIAKWISYGGETMTYIREVEILDDSSVYVEKNKFKADKFNLQQKVLLKDFEQWNNLEFCKLAVQENGFALQFVKEQTDEICLTIEAKLQSKLKASLLSKLAVQQNGIALQYVKEQTEEICKLAVQQDGYALTYVKDQTEEICKFAVQQDGYALQYVKEQTDEICKLAVQKNGPALQYVKEQTEEICKLAVQQNGKALYYVKDQLKKYV